MAKLNNITLNIKTVVKLSLWSAIKLRIAGVNELKDCFEYEVKENNKRGTK